MQTRVEASEIISAEQPPFRYSKFFSAVQRGFRQHKKHQHCSELKISALNSAASVRISSSSLLTLFSHDSLSAEAFGYSTLIQRCFSPNQFQYLHMLMKTSKCDKVNRNLP